jgi:hypothetical protein
MADYKAKSILPVIAIIAVAPAILLGGCGGDGKKISESYAALPVLELEHAVVSDTVGLNPVRLQLFHDTLYVSYAGLAQIDAYTTDLVKLAIIELNDPEPVYPTDFVVIDSELIVCDHARRLIAIYDREGKFRESYGMMPDNVTPMSPFAVTYFGGVLYVGDAGQRKVLAISMADAPNITERGELILSIPGDTGHTIGFPSALMVTPDGRMLVGDAGQGKTLVFTCDGRFIYAFDSLQTQLPMAPQGFAVDDIIDPSVQDSSSFDPSGIRVQGRIHVVDANAGQIHMFNPVGKYIASYPENIKLEKPSDIAIDVKNRQVFIAEPATGRVLTFRYGE